MRDVKALRGRRLAVEDLDRGVSEVDLRLVRERARVLVEVVVDGDLEVVVGPCRRACRRGPRSGSAR